MRAVAVAIAFAFAAVPAADAAPQCLTKSKLRHRTCQRLAAHSSGHATGMRMIRNVAIATPSPQPVPEAPSPPAPPAPSRLGVVAREFSLLLSRTTLPSGAAIVELQNRGEDAHNLRIERTDGAGAGVDVPLAESGEVSSATASLAPGEYRLYCALSGHDAAGMHARLTVAP